MRKFREQADDEFRSKVRQETVTHFIDRMKIVRLGQNKIAAALQIHRYGDTTIIDGTLGQNDLYSNYS